MLLYLLDHRNWMDDEYYDTKFIGIYSSQANALCTIEKFSKLPGFCDHKTDFHIETAEVNLKNRKSKKEIVYLLTITKVLDEGDDEITIAYHVCSNVICARFLWMVKTIILCLKHQKIYIDTYEIDKDHWTEGFVTIFPWDPPLFTWDTVAPGKREDS